MNKCISENFCSPSSRQGGNFIHGTYFPHIDGLRTFAVLSVVLYHLQEWLCPGGYTGVDIFFVISGYLIGGGLVRSLKENSFSLTSFYCRRIKRIMPAYFCLIAVVLAFGCFVLDCDDLRSLGRTVRSSTLFITNIYFNRTTGDYFSPATEENPLLNLWSLSVEEQFYLVIPLALLFMWKTRRSALMAAVCGTMLLSLCVATYQMDMVEQSKAFYLLPGRAWELLAVCLLALAPAVADKTRGKGLLALAGWTGILAPFACYTSSTLFPGYTALPSVAGAVLLIRYGSDGWSGRILKHPVCTGIGKISYSLYLWHWPVIVYWTYCRFNECGVWDYAGMFLASFALAYLSWKFVEMPFRTAPAFWTRKNAFVFTMVGCCMLGFAGEWLKWTDGARNYWHVAINNMPFPEYWRGQAFPPLVRHHAAGQGRGGKGKPDPVPSPGARRRNRISPCQSRQGGPRTGFSFDRRQPCHGQFSGVRLRRQASAQIRPLFPCPSMPFERHFQLFRKRCTGPAAAHVPALGTQHEPDPGLAGTHSPYSHRVYP